MRSKGRLFVISTAVAVAIIVLWLLFLSNSEPEPTVNDVAGGAPEQVVLTRNDPRALSVDLGEGPGLGDLELKRSHSSAYGVRTQRYTELLACGDIRNLVDSNVPAEIVCELLGQGMWGMPLAEYRCLLDDSSIPDDVLHCAQREFELYDTGHESDF